MKWASLIIVDNQANNYIQVSTVDIYRKNVFLTCKKDLLYIQNLFSFTPKLDLKVLYRFLNL